MRRMIEWYPGAVVIPGPESKQGYGSIRTRIAKGLMGHSAEGEWAGMLARLESTSQVTWTGSILTVGTVIQHYPLSACCWHAGSSYPNTRWSGWELEGRAGEPLTMAQKLALADVIFWQAEQEDWPGFILKKDTGTLHEHNWYFATACPSGRIPWEEVIEMATVDTQARKDIAVLKAAQHLAGLALKGDWQDLANALKYLGVVAA